MNRRSPVSPARRPPSDGALGVALAWHGAWAVVVIASLSALAFAAPEMTWAAMGALLAGAAPSAAALLLLVRDSPWMRASLLALWAGCVGLACGLTGGVAGPLAVWCLVPVAAAAVFGGASLLAEAATLSVAAAGAVALAGLAGLTPPSPPSSPSFWLSVIGLLTTSIGLGGGLLLYNRRVARQTALRRAAEADLERLLSGQPDLILSLNTGGRVICAFGYAPKGIDVAALPGAPIADLAVERDRARVDLAAALGAGECVFALAGAPERSCVLALRRGRDGRVVGVLRDASLQRAREAELEGARDEALALNAGKSRFLANMSHELRTPLNAIMGFSDVMRTKLFGDLQPKYVEYAEMIHDAGQHLLDLINDVLDISKIEAERFELSLEPFDAREAISGALRLTRLQADEAGVSLRGLLPPRALDVEADRRAIKQIVLNLVANALKFTPRGGSVTVAAQGYDRDLEIVVSDSGVGIAESDLERLGRPFEQAGDAAHKVLGTGLGLSLVRAFAELHGGAMSIESQLGEGTSVTVRLPVLTAQAADDEAALASGAKIIAFNPGKG